MEKGCSDAKWDGKAVAGDIQIELKLNRTKGYWYGAAGDSCRSAFAGSMDEVKQACSAISGYPGKLCEAAGVYTAAEAKNQTVAGALKRNIL